MISASIKTIYNYPRSTSHPILTNAKSASISNSHPPTLALIIKKLLLLIPMVSTPSNSQLNYLIKTLLSSYKLPLVKISYEDNYLKILEILQ